MKKLVKKIISTIMITTMLFANLAYNVFAMDNGTYTVNTNTYYLNPETGKTDDGGTSNVELGEGMCRSAIYEKAVIEKNGSDVYVTVRLNLYSNLSNIRFAVQEKAGQPYNSVKYSLLKESASSDTADLRFKIPNENSYIQAKIYVGPMGRDVCFYMNLDTSSAVSSGKEMADSGKVDEPKTSKFNDIKKHWAEDAINAVVSKGLFNGTSETEFSPNGVMSRGMFVTVLGRLSGENISGTSSFKDVNINMYYSPYIAWANKNGIVNGTSATTFSPDAPITCEQAAAIIVKYANYKKIELKTKSIAPSTTGASAWALESVVTAGKAGIITKQNTNGYDYKSNATRACVASMLNNFNEYYNK